MESRSGFGGSIEDLFMGVWGAEIPSAPMAPDFPSKYNC